MLHPFFLPSPLTLSSEIGIPDSFRDFHIYDTHRSAESVYQVREEGPYTHRTLREMPFSPKIPLILQQFLLATKHHRNQPAESGSDFMSVSVLAPEQVMITLHGQVASVGSEILL